jgi:hypothetical protein
LLKKLESVLIVRINYCFLLPSVGTFLAGILILIYSQISAPGWQFFRFYLGDVVAVAFLYFLLSLFWAGSAYLRAAIIGTIALSIEFAQLFGLTPKNGNFLTQITLGSHFELWDLVAYAVGLIFAVALEWRFLKPKDK